MKSCSKCNTPKEENEFHIRPSGKLSGHCKECQRSYCRDHYNRNKKMYIDKARKRSEQCHVISCEYVIEYLQDHPCVDCGEDDAVVLQFDHVGGKKRDTIANLMRNFLSLEMLKAEIEKCVVRCANCHLRKTAKDFKFWKTIKPTQVQFLPGAP